MQKSGQIVVEIHIHVVEDELYSNEQILSSQRDIYAFEEGNISQNAAWP